jgi:hypothetical protein
MKRITIIGLAVILMLVTVLSASCVNKNSISWETSRVSLKADDFYIIADEEYFYADVNDVDLKSDPGNDEYFTLEVEWKENNVEMRLFIYFSADQYNWWSGEIRTYDGKEDGEWIYYTGEFFKTGLGNTFTGNVDIYSDEENEYTGQIHFKGLQLETKLKPHKRNSIDKE